MVRSPSRGRRCYRLDLKVPQAADHERIWRGRALRPPRHCERALDRGVSGKSLSASDRDVETHLFSSRDLPMDTKGLPQSAADVAPYSGLLQSQRAGERSRRKEEGFLCAAGILPGFANRRDVGVSKIEVREIFCKQAKATAFRHWPSWLRGPPTFGLWVQRGTDSEKLTSARMTAKHL